MKKTTEIKVPFDGIIGQEPAKRTLTYMLERYRDSHYFPSTLFCAPKGQGKTTLAIETAKHLCLFDEKGKPQINAETGRPRLKPLIKVNCASLTNVKAFVNSLLLRYVQDKDVTVLFDEASEIPHSVSMVMLDMFNTDAITKGNFVTSFTKDEYTCDFDFRRQTFLFATSERQRVFHALTSRLEKLSLQEYTLDELGGIVRKGMGNCSFEDKELLTDVSQVVRDNARDASLLARKIKEYLEGRGRTVFTHADWRKVKEIFNIKPLGLDDIELAVLRYLSAKTDGTSLTSLSSKTGLTKDSLQREHELFLLKHGLMEIQTSGRLITGKGLDYLKALAK